VTEQLPELSVQLVLAGETPAPLAEKLTVPVGVLAVPVSVSLTVAVQVEPWLIATGLVQFTVVEVERVADSPTASSLPLGKSPNNVMPVACVLVGVFVPTVGLVQAEPSFFRTMNCVVSAPACTSAEV
jgi:hypothetical protein